MQPPDRPPGHCLAVFSFCVAPSSVGMFGGLSRSDWADRRQLPGPTSVGDARSIEVKSHICPKVCPTVGGAAFEKVLNVS